MSNCPHKNIIHCPLYVAAHMGNGHGCDDGRLAEGGCAVDRGLDYQCAVRELERIEFKMVAELEFWERAEASQEQRDRNMRFAAVH